jgi:hypothetical protein
MILSNNTDIHVVQGKKALTIDDGEDDDVESDVTLLNIRENMNEGKSQTWFSYAETLATSHGIHYLVKTDTDTVIFLDKYFDFVDQHLYPAPYNRYILAGYFVDKWWWGTNLDEMPMNAFLKKKYGRAFHVYAAGQWYLMSPDLARMVREEASVVNQKELAAVEDHDISYMIFRRCNRPLHLVVIALKEQHWQHRVKINLGKTFRRIWDNEKARMAQIVLEQQVMLTS